MPAAAGCSIFEFGRPEESGRGDADVAGLQIVTTTYPIYDFAQQIAGERAAVDLLLPGVTDAHEFEPSPRDITRIMNSDLLLYNGAGLEPWLDGVLPEIARNASGPKAVDLTATAPLLMTPGGVLPDPHVWLDPLRAVVQVETIASALAALDLQGAESYKRRATEFTAQLQQLHTEFETILNDCGQRLLIVQHGAFGYLADRYGLQQQVVGASTVELEPSARTLDHLIRTAVEQNAKAVFYDALINPGAAAVVAEEAGIALLPLHTLENRSPAEIAADMGYLSLMRQNLANLARGLACRAGKA